MDVTNLAQSFGLAVLTSCAIAISSSKAVARYQSLQRFKMFIPYLSVVSASTANLLFSRMEEWKNGVPVFDAPGKEAKKVSHTVDKARFCNLKSFNFFKFLFTQLGTSPLAGYQGVMQTIVTRAWLVPVPALFFTPILMNSLRK